HWLTKHPRGDAATRRKFERIREDARRVLDDYGRRYLFDLASDHMLADSVHALQGVKNETHLKSATKYGLSAAECAAIAVYVGPSYKFINPSLDKQTGRLASRLRGFVEETGSSLFENVANSRAKNKAAETKASGKIKTSGDSVARATSESLRHATVATL